MRRGEDWARQRFGEARVGRFATVGGDGSPHLVPITFVLVGDTLVTAVDQKPKSTRALRRLDNIAYNPFVTVLVDEYDDVWSHLWWARADGWARILEPDQAEGFDQLVAKYSQYRMQRPEGPAVVITVNNWSGWSAS